MKLDFIKMHGCGNDYVYVDAFKNKISNPNKLSEIVSDRHFSIGGDGMIMVCPSDCADAKMRMFNADGSEGKMCGNGVRCVAKFVYDNGISKKNPLKIETLSGIKERESKIKRATTLGRPSCFLYRNGSKPFIVMLSDEIKRRFRHSSKEHVRTGHQHHSLPTICWASKNQQPFPPVPDNTFRIFRDRVKTLL